MALQVVSAEFARTATRPEEWPRGPAPEDVPHDLADEDLAVAVRVVRGGVHERDARDERLVQGFAVDVASVVHPITAEADFRDARMNAAERAVRGRGKP